MRFVIVLMVMLTLSCLGNSKSEILVKKDIEEGESIMIGVISDTHIPTRARKIPSEVFQIFQGAKYIIHAGDFVAPEAIGELEKIAPVVGVKGNMDFPAIDFPEVNSLEVMGWRIGIIHDSFSPFRMRKMKRVAEENNFNVLIFGHTHRPFIKKEGGVLFLNPGSPTNPLLTKPSVAILKVSKNKIEAEIIELT
jgi:hypothetical protein